MTNIFVIIGRKNLPLAIPMQLCKKSKNFCGIFIVFLESTLNFKHCEKKNNNKSHSLSFSHIIDPKRRGYLSA